jgi:plastocyanin
MSRKVVGVTIAIFFLLAVALWGVTSILRNADPAAVSSTRLSERVANQTCGLATGIEVAAKEDIRITDSGFEPQTIAIKVGETVRWTNTSGTTQAIASDPHTSHTMCYGMSSSDLKTGDGYSFTFAKAGTWTYHDEHVGRFTGSVLVTE